MVFFAAQSLCGAGKFRERGDKQDRLGYFHQFSGGKLSLEDLLRSRSRRVVPEPAGEIVEVAIDATKEIRQYALEWTLRNVAQSGDSITLLAVIPQPDFMSCGWGFFGECIMRTRSRESQDLEEQIKDSCHQMMQQVQKLQKDKKVRIKVQVVEGGVRGITALSAERMQATWVVLDRHLKQEGKYCLQKLECNVVLVNRFEAKILRLNLKRPLIFDNESTEYCSFESGSSLIPNNISHLPKLFRSFDRQESDTRYENPSIVYEPFIQNSSPEMDVSLTSSELENPLDFSSESWPSPYSSGAEGWMASPNFHGFSRAEVTSRSIYATSSLEYGSTESISSSEDDQASPVTQSECSSSESFPRIKLSTTSGNLFSTSGRNHPASPEFLSTVYQNNRSTKKEKSISFLKIGTVKKGSISEPLSPIGQSPRKAQNFFNQMKRFQDVHNLSGRLLTGTRVFKEIEKTAMLDLFSSLPQKDEGLEVFDFSIPAAAGMNMSKGISKTDKGTASELNPDMQGKLEINCSSSNLKHLRSLSGQPPPGPPPLCSICQHKSPHFGRPPQIFIYADLEAATNAFSIDNFLAEGGFGSVHRGVLPDGQVIAVKKLKLASSQGDNEFCVEVEVLSCAQQRNVVTLIGYCVEDHRRLLVYEFICNGSLDSHLFGQKNPALEWQARQKIAVGTARGLRYLHEECRVGCIIHRDMRPNNILLTHDFEPMVGDFGLARWQPDGALEVETRIIGTVGYLSPEYAQSGQITEKADVYSFGIVLLELVTGRKAIDLSRPKGQQCLTEWSRPLLDLHLYHELADPRLHNHYNNLELYCMLQTARLCICPNPDLRPRMSQVMRMLEGNVTVDASHLSSPWNSRHSKTFSFGNVLSEDVRKSANLSSHSNRWETSGLSSLTKRHSEPFPFYRNPSEGVRRSAKLLSHCSSWSLIPL